MPYKIVEVGGVKYAELKDDRAVFVHADGKEVPFDADAALTTIAARNKEAQTNREKAEDLEKKLKAFEGITDPADAIKALETVRQFKSGELITAGKAKEVEDAAKRSAEEAVAAANKKSSEDLAVITANLNKVTGELHNEKIGGFFDRTKVKDKVAVPMDLVKAKYQGNFKMEEGKIVIYGVDGNKVYSRVKPGELAEPDEALEILIDTDPNRDSILKGAGGGGGGRLAQQGSNGEKLMGRADFDKLDPVAKQTAMQSGVKIA